MMLGRVCTASRRGVGGHYKIREHSVAKVPIILVIGAKEAADSTVAMRRLGGKDQENLVLKEATARLQEEAAGPLART